ncbi:MAG: PTS sugar transporter subunit IIC, partial [Candidatus Coatesbacteria bacterium]
QLLWVGQIPVGAYVPPSAPLTAAAAVGLAVPAGVPLAVRAVLAAAAAIPVGVAAGKLDLWIKVRNVGILHRAENDLLDNRPHALGGAVVRGVATFFLKDFLLLLVAVFLGAAVLGVVLPRVPEAWYRGFEVAFVVSPAVGVAAALRTYWRRRNALAFAVGAAAAALALTIFTIAL